MQINSIVSPFGTEPDPPYGYAPMDVSIEILICAKGQIGAAELKPMEIDDKTRKRRWLPDLPRTSGIAPIIGSDKLDYYHPTRKPEAAAAMVVALTQRLDAVPELQWIIDWMQSDRPFELDRQIFELPATDATALVGGRIVWRTIDDGYIHDFSKIKSAHAEQTLKRAGGDGDLMGTLPKIHSKKLATPLMGCADDMFRSWGQTEKQALNISAKSAVIATQRYTQLLEARGHQIRVGSDRYWVWGALPAMAEIDEATKQMAKYFGSDGADLDPVTALEDLIKQVNTGAKSVGKLPETLKIACGYIGIGGSGKGRAAIGQMAEQCTLELLSNLLSYHHKQRRYINRSTPFWVFGLLTVAEGSSKKAIDKANEQIFEAMIGGHSPPATITAAIIHRLKIEGVPNVRAKKSSREWTQTAYLTWIAPNFIEHGNFMKPEAISLDNLLAWHVGRVFAACKTIAYHYAARGGAPADNWKNPLDAYRQILFSSPAQGFSQVLAKVSPYLEVRRDKAGWYDQALAELGEDCPGMCPPKRWTDEQAFFFALGISEMAQAKFAAKSGDGAGEPETSTQKS